VADVSEVAIWTGTRVRQSVAKRRVLTTAIV
jgi:hypothetical protein